MKNKIAVALGAAALIAAVSAGPAGATDNNAGKASLLNQAFGSCNTGVGGGNPQDGFAILKQNGDGTVSETVSVKNGPANAVYYVSLVQTPSGSGCNATDANVELTTNGQGNGNIHVNVPEVPGTTDAFAELIPANVAAGASGIIASQDVVF